MTKAEMVTLVEKVLNGDYRDEEVGQIILLLRRKTLCPNVSDLIFYSDPPLSPDEVIERALAYKPIILHGPGG